MPRVTVLPHPELCPPGAEFEARCGTFLCDALQHHGIALENACAKSCACSTCHVIIRKGYDALDTSTEDEDDQLDRAWGVEPTSRLACQVVLRREDLTVELPRYSINLTRENS